MRSMSHKLAIVVRKDLKLPAGKMAAQAGHAAVDAVLSTKRSIIDDWLRDGGKKIVVWATDKSDLMRLRALAKSKKLNVTVVTDAGKTVVKPGTVTCIGIGPDKDEKLDAVTGSLKMV